MANQVTLEYLEECRSSDGRLRNPVREATLPQVYAQEYGKVLLPRPILAVHEEISAFADDLGAVFRVLTSLPERCFGGDLGRYCAEIGLDDRLAAVMRLGATGEPELYARADAFHDGTAFRLLELNVGSELGGVDTAQLNRSLLGVDGFREFADRHGLRYVDTLEHLVAGLRRAAQPVTSGDLVVALLEGPGALPDHSGVFLSIQEALREHGIDLLLGEVQELGSKDGKLTLRGASLDVVLRYFSAGQIAESPVAVEALGLIMRAHADRKTALFTPLEGALFTSKASLGLLHDGRVRGSLTEAERALVDRVVPRTWVIGTDAGSSTPADITAAFEYARENRESLVLKPGIGYSADGVVIGRELTDQAWVQALEKTKGRDYVAQQLVTPAPEPVLDPVTGETEDWIANWGIFATDSGYAGAFVRALRPTDGSVITFANPGTRGACVFTCADGKDPQR